MTDSGTLVLVILDGWGIRDERKHNAIALARTPAYTELLERYHHTTLIASGERVGLPVGQMGNSEVGHMNIGAGRVVYQDLTRIDRAIVDSTFFANDALSDAMERCIDGRHALHLIGLLSDGGVHSHQRHLYALLAMARRKKLVNVFIHVFTDGRDTSPTSGLRYLNELERETDRIGVGRIVSVTGRYFAMDRDARWERTRLAFNVLTRGDGQTGRGAMTVLQESYAQGITDEFIRPTTLVDSHSRPISVIRDGDSVICFNFRADRVRQITRALASHDFDGFDRVVRPSVSYCCMTQYDARLHLPVAFPQETFKQHFGEFLSMHNVNNLRLAETEKYAHVTYFFNCGTESPYDSEDRVLIPSPKVATYDLQPEMSAPLITNAFIQSLAGRRHRVVICNFANADMVGHTGHLEAAVKAVEVLDSCLSRIVVAVRAAGGRALITSDHGNCEQMWDDELDSPHTAHTSNPVPFILVDDKNNRRLRQGGALCDVAPTIIGLLGLTPPQAMTGTDLRETCASEA